MTSTPIKEAGRLFPFMASGRTAPDQKTGAGSAGGFGDVMSRTSYGGNDFPVQSRNDAVNAPKKTQIDQSGSRKDVVKTESAKPAKVGEVSPEQSGAVEEAGQELVRETAEELGVSEEEVLCAMEELGFCFADLLNADNLTALVMTLSGEDSTLALLTDESLYGKLQNLLETLKGINGRLMEELSLSPEEFGAMLEHMAESDEAQNTLTEDYADVLNETGAKEEGPEITVTVKQGDQEIKMTADENGNTKQVEEVAVKEEKPEDKPSDEKGKGGFEDGGGRQGLAETNPMLDASPKNQIQNPEAVFEQAVPAGDLNPREIMDQILDYMKIQLKPGMEQLEMQLHPESLGTVHIQITSKAGEITAQFHVQNESVKAALESQISELKENLRDQGVKVEAVEVTVESHGFESNLWQGQDRDERASYQNSRKGPRRINLNALDEEFEEAADEEERLTAEMMRVNGGTVDYTA